MQGDRGGPRSRTSRPPDTTSRAPWRHADGSGSFAEFYERWRPLVRRAAESGGLQGIAAEDVVQQVFLTLCKDARWREIGHPASYVWRAGRNEALKHRRRLDREVDLEHVQMERLLGPHPDPHRTWQLRHRPELFRRLLERLPRRCAEVMRLKYVEGMGNAKAAEELDITEKGVERQVTVGVERLRELMGTPLGHEWLSTFEDVGE